MTTEETKTKKKPKWLRILEQQSWQAELIISGVAIFGSLALRTELKDVLDWVLVSFQGASMGAFFILFIYLSVGTTFLITGFILHFILRALWIGMLGLVSVYPNGINENSEIYSPHLLKEIKKEFPDVNDFNKKLDAFCSILFSIIAVAVQAFIAFAIWILIWVAIQVFLLPFVGEKILDIVQTTVFTVFIGSALILGSFNSKKMQKKAWVKKVHYPFVRRFGKIFSLFFYKPYSYISYTLFTNPKMKPKHVVLFFLFFIFLGMSTMSIEISNSNTMLFTERIYFNNNSKSNTFYAHNYENQLTTRRVIYPTIQAESIIENHIRLFIPRFKRENPSIEKICGIYEEKEENSRRENRSLAEDFKLACLPNYYEISIDDKTYTKPSFSRHLHKNNREVGYLSYLLIDSLSKGQHLLKIERAYFNEDGEKAVQYIPFWRE